MSKRQTAEGECSQCYARILWATNSATGRPMPLNLRAEKVTGTSVGPFYLLDDFEMICSRADFSTIEQAVNQNRALYSNHLVTCEKRNQNQAA